jgi:hypothetical protein
MGCLNAPGVHDGFRNWQFYLFVWSQCGLLNAPGVRDGFRSWQLYLSVWTTGGAGGRERRLFVRLTVSLPVL